MEMREGTCFPGSDAWVELNKARGCFRKPGAVSSRRKVLTICERVGVTRHDSVVITHFFLCQSFWRLYKGFLTGHEWHEDSQNNTRLITSQARPISAA